MARSGGDHDYTLKEQDDRKDKLLQLIWEKEDEARMRMVQASQDEKARMMRNGIEYLVNQLTEELSAGLQTNIEEGIWARGKARVMAQALVGMITGKKDINWTVPGGSNNKVVSTDGKNNVESENNGSDKVKDQNQESRKVQDSDEEKPHQGGNRELVTPDINDEIGEKTGDPHKDQNGSPDKLALINTSRPHNEQEQSSKSQNHSDEHFAEESVIHHVNEEQNNTNKVGPRTNERDGPNAKGNDGLNVSVDNAKGNDVSNTKEETSKQELNQPVDTEGPVDPELEILHNKCDVIVSDMVDQITRIESAVTASRAAMRLVENMYNQLRALKSQIAEQDPTQDRDFLIGRRGHEGQNGGNEAKNNQQVVQSPERRRTNQSVRDETDDTSAQEPVGERDQIGGAPEMGKKENGNEQGGGPASPPPTKVTVSQSQVMRGIWTVDSSGNMSFVSETDLCGVKKYHRKDDSIVTNQLKVWANESLKLEEGEASSEQAHEPMSETMSKASPSTEIHKNAGKSGGKGGEVKKSNNPKVLGSTQSITTVVSQRREPGEKDISIRHENYEERRMKEPLMAHHSSAQGGSPYGVTAPQDSYQQNSEQAYSSVESRRKVWWGDGQVSKMGEPTRSRTSQGGMMNKQATQHGVSQSDPSQRHGHGELCGSEINYQKVDYRGDILIEMPQTGLARANTPRPQNQVNSAGGVANTRVQSTLEMGVHPYTSHENLSGNNPVVIPSRYSSQETRECQDINRRYQMGDGSQCSYVWAQKEPRPSTSTPQIHQWMTTVPNSKVEYGGHEYTNTNWQADDTYNRYDQRQWVWEPQVQAQNRRDTAQMVSEMDMNQHGQRRQETQQMSWDTVTNAVRFAGERNTLSNFSPCKLVAGGKVFNCVEQIYQFKKATHMRQYQKAEEIMSVNNPRRMKEIGQMTTDSEWFARRKRVMEDIIKVRMAQDAHFRQTLLETGSCFLIEDVRSSRYWGVGVDGKGQNTMGRILMQIRDEERQKPWFHMEGEVSQDKKRKASSVMTSEVPESKRQQSPYRTPEPRLLQLDKKKFLKVQRWDIVYDRSRGSWVKENIQHGVPGVMTNQNTNWEECRHRIIIVGDSLVRDEVLSTMLLENLGAQGGTRTRCYRGWNTQDICLDLQTVMCEDTENGPPDIVVTLSGTNHIVSGSASEKELTIENSREMMRIIEDGYGARCNVWCTIPPAPRKSAAANKLIRDVNSQNMLFAMARGWCCTDLDRMWEPSDAGYTPDDLYFEEDRLHLSFKGVMVVANAITKCIEEHRG